MEVRGREIRTTDTKNPNGEMLRSGQQVFLACDNIIMQSDEKKVFCNYRDLPRIVKPNDIIHIDDGKITCLVTDIERVSLIMGLECLQEGINVEIKGGGVLGPKKSIKLGGGKHEALPIINHLDEQDLLNYAIKHQFDFVALPYCIRKKDI